MHKKLKALEKRLNFDKIVKNYREGNMFFVIKMKDRIGKIEFRSSG